MIYVNVSETEAELILVQIFRKQFEGYMKQELERSNLDRELQDIFIHTSERK